ncbi:vacuolar protein sorting-associated protein 13-like protein [Helianthus annuus]|uniref:vacuolar protein sorting-associated protein 13-like protein n=1 Tax=Helianthus annuus TaxID=4232 RepID=UPI000B907734|nr:vacuolar protein sorting-associated protein 13-like protein [Helianthus annuus]
MDTEEEIAYYYYVSQQEYPIKIKEVSEDVSEKTVNVSEVGSEKAEKVSEIVLEKAPVFDHSSDEESDDDYDDRVEFEKLEFYRGFFSLHMFNMLFSAQAETLKNKQTAKKKNQKAVNVEENAKSEKEQVDNIHHEKTKQDETSELSLNGEYKPEEKVQAVEEQVEEIPAFKMERKADVEKILEMCSNCEKSNSENVKLLREVHTKHDKSSKTNSSNANLRTKEKIKKENLTNQTDEKSKKVSFSEKVFIKVFDGDEFSSETKELHIGNESGLSKSDKPRSGNESGLSKPEEPYVEVKDDISIKTMDDANFPSLSNGNLKQKTNKPKIGQAWVNLFK